MKTYTHKQMAGSALNKIRAVNGLWIMEFTADTLLYKKGEKINVIPEEVALIQ